MGIIIVTFLILIGFIILLNRGILPRVFKIFCIFTSLMIGALLVLPMLISMGVSVRDIVNVLSSSWQSVRLVLDNIRNFSISDAIERGSLLIIAVVLVITGIIFLKNEERKTKITGACCAAIGVMVFVFGLNMM